MKNARKLFALMLALAMMLSLAMPALADENATTAATYTVTITGHKAGHTYEAYQIFKGDLDKSGAILSNISWGDGIDGAAFLAFLTSETATNEGIFSEKKQVDGSETTVANVFAGCVNAEDVSKILNGYADKDKMLDAFAKYAGNYLTTPQGVSSAGTGASYTISNLPAGYYLIKDQDDSLTGEALKDDFYTKFMLEVVANVPVSVKGSVPTINKTTADTATGSYGESVSAMVGETVYFELAASLPSNFDIFDDYFFTFNDTMSKGLTFNKIEKVYIERANAQVDIPADFIDLDLSDEDPSTDAVKVTNNADGSSSFEVKVGDLKDKNFPALLLENKIVVRYSAIVNEDAIIGSTGNPNEVTLDYSNNPYDDGEGTTGPDIAVVFTFGLNVNKHDKADANTKLAGAEFVLYRRELYREEGTTKDLLRLNFVVVDENGVAKDWLTVEGIEVAATTAQTWENVKAALTAEQLASITLTTDAQGNISVPGLDIHTYTLLEIKAPDGYNLPRDPFTVVMTPVVGEDNTITMKYQFGSGEEIASTDGYADVDIANGKGNTLPSTGGMGTTMFYLIGGLMAVTAVVLLVTKKRMSVN